VNNADRKRVHRALADALARIDPLWNRDELVKLANEHRSSVWLRERLINELASEDILAIDPESFESLLDAVRMTR
jgi:hypothetical protein